MKWTADLEHFPYPFKGSIYRYSNNSLPMQMPICIEITPDYKDEMMLKRDVAINKGLPLNFITGFVGDVAMYGKNGKYTNIPQWYSYRKDLEELKQIKQTSA